MNKIIMCLWVFTLLSCQYFDRKVPSEKELLEQELKKINWNNVDAFPSVLQCEAIEDVELKKNCFFNFMKLNIQNRIGIDSLKLYFPEIDTLKVQVTVNANATLLFESQTTNDSLHLLHKIKIDSILTSRLFDFPTVEPAIKRGIKVRTQFVVPIPIRN